MDRFPFYTIENKNHWQNTIRHNLSKYKCYVKVKREEEKYRNGGYWTLDPKCLHMFGDTSYYRRIRSRRKTDMTLSSGIGGVQNQENKVHNTYKKTTTSESPTRTSAQQELKAKERETLLSSLQTARSESLDCSKAEGLRVPASNTIPPSSIRQTAYLSRKRVTCHVLTRLMKSKKRSALLHRYP